MVARAGNSAAGAPPLGAEHALRRWPPGGAEGPSRWLPLADTSRNVEDERADPASTLSYVRELIALRRPPPGAPHRRPPRRGRVWGHPPAHGPRARHHHPEGARAPRGAAPPPGARER